MVHEPATPFLTRRRALLLLLVVTTFAVFVRSVEMGALLPQMLEPDADYVREALVLRAHRDGRLPDLSTLLPDYPLLLPWLLSWLPLEPPPPASSAPLAEHLAVAAAPWLWGRRLVALVSMLLVPATYLTARAVLSRGASLLAAAFAAASLAHVLYSQQARPHGALVALVAVALTAAMHLRRTGTVGAHLLAGSACALALACLHTGVFLLPALVVAAWLAPRRSVGRLVLALAPVALVVPLAYPQLLDSSGLDSTSGVLRMTGHRIQLDLFHGQGFVIGPWLAWSHEPALTALAAGALLLALGRLVSRRPLVEPSRRADTIVLAAFGVPFALVLGVFDTPWDKYQLPLLPLACVLGAGFAEHVATRFTRRPALLVGGSLALLALPAYASARLAVLRARPDSSELAVAWIQANLDPERDVVLESYSLSLPLLRRPADDDPVPDWALSPWDLYQRGRPELAAREDAWRLQPIYVPAFGHRSGRAVLDHDVLVDAIRASGAGWIVLERRGAWQAPDDETPAAIVTVGGVQVAAFEPVDPAVVDLDSRGWLLGNRALLRALTATCWGPRIEVWRLGAPR